MPLLYTLLVQTIAQLVYLRRAQGEAEVPANVAQAIVQPVYLRRAQDDGETPKTGLVAVLGTAETVFGVSGCFRSPLLWFIT